MADTEKAVTLYLTSWQKRMLKDFMSASALGVRSIDRVNWVKIKITDRRTWVMYRQPVQAIKEGAWNMYLTDEQIATIIGDAGLRAKIAALNVAPDMLESGALKFG